MSFSAGTGTFKQPLYMFTIDNPNPEDHLETEWLLTNGLGGYAMGTVLGVNTRRYHGLLVAATKPPVGRIVALHSMIEQLVIPHDDGTEEVVDLSTQMFVGPDGEPMLHPDGWKRLVRFALKEREVAWVYETPGCTLTKSLRFGDRADALNVTYKVDAPGKSVDLRIRPFIQMRGFHRLQAQELTLVDSDPGSVELRSDAGDDLYLGSDDCDWVAGVVEWRAALYLQERSRKYEAVEHLWSPGHFELTVGGWEQGDIGIFCGAVGLTPDRAHRPGQITLERLHIAAFEFVVGRGNDEQGRAPSIIAGYPWFADWGRDAMISLPGLLLCTNRIKEAGQVLSTFASQVKDGLIPNRFDDDGGEPYYNTVDASLWFVYAVWQYQKVSDGKASGTGIPPVTPEEELINACRQIINAYRRGISHHDARLGDPPQDRFSIRMDGDSLINAGDAHSQLTWMDAKRDGHVFTPRQGRAVEVNALWHNALHCLADMTDDEDEAGELREVAGHVALSFQMNFWWPEHECLRDVLPAHQMRHDEDDVIGVGALGKSAPHDQLRPNQIIAVSLPHSPLTRDQQRAVVECVRSRFLTPYGLRSLDREDMDYCPRYEGNMWQRDRAYHNGTVWPWLIGPYCEAVLRASDFNDDARSEARQAIQPLLDEMQRTSGRTCLGQLAEVYDGDPPHRPDGCPAQAWSVAEVLRIANLLDESGGSTSDAGLPTGS